MTPDLAAFGKAMANGFPLAAVVGKRDVMEAALSARGSRARSPANRCRSRRRLRCSISTKATTTCAPALARVGGAIRSAVEAAVNASGIEGVTVAGLDPMWLMRFDDPEVERAFLEGAVREGVLFKRGRVQLRVARA